MAKKKLLMTASTFPRWAGDTEPRFILDLARAVNRYYDVTVLAPAAPGAKDEETLEGVRVIRYHYLPVRKWETLCYPGAIVARIREKKARALQVPFLLFALWVRLLRLKGKYDVIQAHWLIPQGIAQSFAGGKYVVTSHGSDLTAMNAGLMRRLKQRCLDLARRVTVVSGRLRQILLENYHVPEEKVEVISMGCDLAGFSPEKRNPVRFASGRRHVLFVGRLVEVKGVRYLIDAMEAVDADLHIVGDGPEAADLRARAERFGDRIVFLGSMPHEALAELYASADVCVFPSIHASDGTEEGFGLVIVEAMACGTPVVASRSGGIVDIVSDGVNGLLAEEKDSRSLADRINAVLSDPELAGRLRAAGLETARRYDYGALAERFARVLDAACEEGRRS